MSVQPTILPRKDHPISRKNINLNALKVLYRLNKSSYLAYLVGGSVRDLMLGRTPKDFDIVTNARPNQIKQLFRNSYLIGRRFRLVHVRFGRDIIEVSTFRRQPQSIESPEGDLMVWHENTFGTPEQDALRRDFTINGLFYDIDSYQVIDYVGGLTDLSCRMIRTIGNPDIRFREDPVRMVRAVRVSARIGFNIDTPVWDSIESYGSGILKCSPPRLLEELMHLLKHGAAAGSLRLLHRSGLMKHLIPMLHDFWNETSDEMHSCLVDQLDRLFPYHESVTAPVILASVFFPMVCSRSQNLKSGMDLRQNVEVCLRPFARAFSLPRAYFDRITQICIGQRWFSQIHRRNFRPMSLVHRDFFPEMLTLFTLQMKADPGRWEEEKQKWLGIIQRASLKNAYRQMLLRVLANQKGQSEKSNAIPGRILAKSR